MAIQAITDASKRLVYAMNDINSGVMEMAKVAQNNAANAEEFAGASETLSSQANYLAAYIEKLGKMVGVKS